MSSPPKDNSCSVYRDAFSDDSLVPSPSSSSTSSISSSSSDSNRKRVKRRPPTWNPLEKYPEFLEREKWHKEEENQMNSEEEEEFQGFLRNYEKYRAKDRAGVPFWEEVRRSVPSFNLDKARDERYFVGYDEEGNEVRYDDEKHLLKRIRQREILQFQAESKKAIEQREECMKRRKGGKRKRADEIKKKGKGTKATKMNDVSFVGKKQGLWWKKGYEGMNVELKKVVKRGGELEYVVANKKQKAGRNKSLQEECSGEEASTPQILLEKMAGNKSKRLVGKDEANDKLKLATEETNKPSSNVDNYTEEPKNLLRALTYDKPRGNDKETNKEEASNDDKPRYLEKEEKFASDEKLLSNDEEEKPESDKSRCEHVNRTTIEEVDTGVLDYDDDGEDCIIPGFEEEAEFKEDENDNGRGFEKLLKILKQENEASPPTQTEEDTLEMDESYDSEDIEIEELHSFEIETEDRDKTTPEKDTETKIKEGSNETGKEMKKTMIFRHSLKFQKEMEERKMEEVRQRALHDLSDMDVTLELMLMDLEGRDANDEESEADRNSEEGSNQAE